MAEEQVKRRLAAILAADVVGYSRLMDQDEAGTLVALQTRRQNTIDPLVSQYEGRIFNVAGDAVLAEFASPVNAVECAIQIQSKMAEANRKEPDNRQVTLRIGVTLGDVMVEGGNLYGQGVNVAARLEGIADAGGVLVSGTAYDHVKGKIDTTFQDLGVRTLKNIQEPIRVYRVASTPKAPSQAPTTEIDRPSIAVLPFANMSGDPEQQYFSDGVTEDIITEISRSRSLLVIARNSSFQYRDKAVDVRQVARELSVRYLLEGSVRKMGPRVRITAQLIDTASGNHLWSERYDRDLEQLFEVQDEVTRTIVSTLAGRVEAAEIKSAMQRRTDNLAAYDVLLRGIELIRGYSPDDNRQARELFEKAVALDPSYALAHAYLALSLLVEHGYGGAPAAVKDKALAIALKAVQLDTTESRAHQFLAQAYRFRSEFDLAITHFERAIALNPNDANGIAQMGFALAIVGEAERGIELIHQAMKLNPFHPEWYWDDLAIASYVARRYEQAVEANLRLVSRKKYWYYARLAACYAQLGKLNEAHQQAAEALRLKPDFRFSAEKLLYKNSADAEHVFEGMRKAGLPE
jgi:TolB-like protein/Flp pilus assembly protein TadD